MEEKAVLIITTVPDQTAAEKITRALLEKRASACVNVIHGVRSFYWWKGKVQDDSELILFIKTRRDKSDEAFQVIRENHPYEVPEIVEVPFEKTHPPYLRWLFEETS